MANGRIMDRVEIIWVDAVLEEGHLPIAVASEIKPIKRKNIGYCISDNDDGILITFGTLENFYKGLIAHDMVMYIPRGAIESVKKLREA